MTNDSHKTRRDLLRALDDAAVRRAIRNEELTADDFEMLNEIALERCVAAAERRRIEELAERIYAERVVLTQSSNMQRATAQASLEAADVFYRTMQK
jgi:hypothetical protein